MLTLEVMKQCRPALVQTEKCQRIHANIFSQSLKNMLHGAGIRYQNCIKFTLMKMLQIRQNFKHNLLLRMKMMKLLIEKMKLSP